MSEKFNRKRNWENRPEINEQTPKLPPTWPLDMIEQIKNLNGLWKKFALSSPNDPQIQESLRNKEQEIKDNFPEHTEDLVFLIPMTRGEPPFSEQEIADLDEEAREDRERKLFDILAGMNANFVHFGYEDSAYMMIAFKQARAILKGTQ